MPQARYLLACLLAVPLLAPIVLAQTGDTTPGPRTIYVAEDSGSEWADVLRKGEGVLRVLYVPAEGFAYRDEAGRLTGLTVEIVRDFVEWVETEHDVELALSFIPEENWRTFYERVRTGSGGVMGIGNVTITAERRAELQFSPPYLTNVAVLISPAGCEEIGRLEDIGHAFADLKPLAFEGTLHEDRLREIRDQHHDGATLSFATSNDEIINRVADGGHYAYVDGYNFWRAEAAGMPVMRHPVADDPTEEFGIIFPLNSDWSSPLEKFFGAAGGYAGTERYRLLLQEHLGAAVADTLLGE